MRLLARLVYASPTHKSRQSCYLHVHDTFIRCLGRLPLSTRLQTIQILMQFREAIISQSIVAQPHMKPGLLPTPTSMSSTSSSRSSPAPWPVQPTPHALPPSVRNQARTLACEMCWRRKLKCDRDPPCSNCIKVCFFEMYIAAVNN